MGEKSADTAANVKKLSVATQMSNKDVQEWSYVFQRCGSSADVLKDSVNKLGIAMAKGDEGSKKISQAFKDLGIATEDNNGKLKSSSELFDDSITKLAEMTDITERNRQAQLLFGGSYTDLLPILNKGTKGIDDLKKRAEELGLVMTDTQVNAGAKYKKSMTEIKEEFTSIGARIGNDVLPYFGKFADWLSNIEPKLHSVIDGGLKALDNVFTFLSTNGKTLGIVLGILLTLFLALNVVKSINFIMETWNSITKASIIVQDALNKTLKGNPIMLIITLIIGLVTVLTILYNKNKDFRDSVNKLFTDMQNTFDKVMKNIIPFIQNVAIPAVEKITESLLKSIKEFILPILILLQNTFEKVFKNNILPFIEDKIIPMFIFLKNTFEEIFKNNIIPIFEKQLLPMFKKVFNEIILIIEDEFIPIFMKIKAVIQDLIEKYIAPNVIPFLQNILIPAIKVAINTIAVIIDILAKSVKFTWDNILKPLIDRFIIPLLVNVLIPEIKKIFNQIAEFIQKTLLPNMAKIKETIQDIIDKYIIPYVIPFLTNVLLPTIKKVIEFILQVLHDSVLIIKKVIDIVIALITNIITNILNAWNLVLKPLLELIIGYFKTFILPQLEIVIGFIVKVIGNIFTFVSDLWNNSLKPIINGILDFISGVFTGNWSKAWNGIKEIVSGVFNGIKDSIRFALNNAIDLINTFISSIGKIKIPDWIPGIGGKEISIPQIPHVPAFEVGTKYLPKDMIIQAHKGEMIVPKSENPYANSGGKVLPVSNGITLTITNFYNNRKEDIEELMNEMEIYRKKVANATGGA